MGQPSVACCAAKPKKGCLQKTCSQYTSCEFKVVKGSETSYTSHRAQLLAAQPLDLFDTLEVSPEYCIFDVRFNSDKDNIVENLNKYFLLCKSNPLTVTTSCFNVWQQGKKTNGFGKIIPAIRSKPQFRVFFFDDNLTLSAGGKIDTSGICNLRDVDTGEFVEFTKGANGFRFERRYKHTIIHTSSVYSNVLVQANILDAMVNEDYFTSIIRKFSDPEDHILVFIDVNGTIVWDDNMTGKDEAETLLSTMFGLVEVRPEHAVEFKWDAYEPVQLEERKGLKQLVVDVCGKARAKSFWSLASCQRFMKELSTVVDMGWIGERMNFSYDYFFHEYEVYMRDIRKHNTEHGIPKSWFRFFKEMHRKHHSISLNTFGVDSKRVVVKCVRDLREVVQLAVDFQLWSELDATNWTAQFVS